MATLSELVKDLDPEAIRLRTALEAHIARGKAEDRVKTAAKLLDDMQAAEADARIIRDGLLADLQQRLDALGQDDEVGRALLLVERAKINANYKPAANALCRAEDDSADAKRALRSAVEEVARHPIVTPERPSSVSVTDGDRP